MKTLFALIIIITASIVTVGCERAVLNKEQFATYNPALFEKLTSLQDVPENISAIIASSIEDRNLKIEQFEKFKLAYFLIPEKQLSILFAKKDSSIIAEKLQSQISGDTYYRFFVHPSQTAQYENLKASYPFIDRDESHYMAATHDQTQSLLIWNTQAPSEEAYVLKSIIKNQTGNMPRIPASLYQISDNSISVIFTNGTHKYSGQEIFKL